MLTTLFHGSWFVFVSLLTKFPVLAQAGFRVSVTCHIFQVFLGALSFVYFAKALAEGYLKSTITQIERRFDIPSSLVGIIDGSFEIGMYYRYLTLLLSTKFLGMAEGHPHCMSLSAPCVKSDSMCKILFGHDLPRPCATVRTYVLSHGQLFCDSSSLTVAHQAPLSIEFPRQEYWSGLLFHSSGNLPDPGIPLQVDSLPQSHWEALCYSRGNLFSPSKQLTSQIFSII